MLTIRLRSRDGLERLKISENATLGHLRGVVAETIGYDPETFVLSMDQALLTSKSPDTFLDLTEDGSSIASLGIKNGSMVYCHYHGTRDVNPGYKRSAFEARPFGAHMDVAALMAKQVRMERQESPDATSVSFDRYAAHAFQAYIQSALAFSIKRCGILYGRVDEEKNVFVDAIFEPEQSGKAERLTFERHNGQEQAAEVIANQLGLQKVGFVFNQSAGDKDYIMNDEEIQQMCELQNEIGEHCVTGVFIQTEADGQVEVHLEAFQCSKQAVELWRDGWFQVPGADVSGTMRMKHPREPDVKLPVMIAGKDTDEVDNDFFLVPVPVRDHDGPLLSSFPVENRLTSQDQHDLKDHLMRQNKKPYTERLADFHLLLWLSTHGFDLQTDMTLLIDAIKQGQPIREGYRLLIENMAGM